MMFQPFGQYSDWIFVLLALPLSWLLLRLEGRGMDALGFDQPRRRLKELAIAFATTAGALTVVHLLWAAVAGVSWQWNPYPDAAIFLEHFTLPLVAKVLIVGLLFQGYLLFQLLRKVGPVSGLWIAAAVFALYDCFALNAFEEPARALGVLLTGGLYGFVLAFAFRQTGSLAAPIGLNFGFHFTNKSVFGSFVPTYELLVVRDERVLPLKGAVPGIVWLIVMGCALGAYVWMLRRRYPPRGEALARM